jgi:hypothetical protein
MSLSESRNAGSREGVAIEGAEDVGVCGAAGLNEESGVGTDEGSFRAGKEKTAAAAAIMKSRNKRSLNLRMPACFHVSVDYRINAG